MTTDLPSLLDIAERIVSERLALLIGIKGDAPGHPFRGNQWTDGTGGEVNIESLSSHVASNIGINPHIKELKILDDQEFNGMLKDNDADLFANSTAAIAFPDGRIYIRKGYEDSALHEVVHRAGFMPDGINVQLNEGITQAATDYIANKIGSSIRSGYEDQVSSINKYVIPLTGLSRDDFFKGYAKADNKSKWIASKISERHAGKFNPEDWSKDIRSRVGIEFERALGQGFADNDYARYLVDELGVTS